MIGLFIGRFQPFHKGHLKAIEYCLKSCSSLVVVVGSAQKGNEKGNPFTAEERMEMVRGALLEGGILEKCRIVPVDDVNDDARWAAHVASKCPKFDLVYSNDPLCTRLFSEAGFEVRGVPFFEREELEATRIRRLMVQGKGWEWRVPEAVARLIKEIGGVERVRRLEG